MPDGIAIEGLNELRKAVKELGDIDSTREFKAAGYDAMANVLVPAAKGRASDRMHARAMETLRPSRVATGGAVRFGLGFPGAMGAEFGAMHDQRRANVNGSPGLGWNQFPGWVRGGRAIFPAVAAESDRIVQEFDRGLEPLMRRLFPD